MKLEKIASLLQGVLPNRVFYGLNIYDDLDSIELPYIIYQEITKIPKSYSDNGVLFYMSKIQITLVTKNKDINLEQKLEKTLSDANFSYLLISEFFNADKTINRIYEISMEEF